MESLVPPCKELELRFSNILRHLNKLQVQMEEDGERLVTLLKGNDKNLNFMKLVAKRAEMESQVTELEKELKAAIKQKLDCQNLIRKEMQALRKGSQAQLQMKLDC